MAETSDTLTPEWIVSQRWFRSKQRPVTSVSEADSAPLRDGSLTVLEVAFADGGDPHYYLAPVIEGREPRDGDGVWRALVAVIADEAELSGRRGHFRGTRASAMDVLLPSTPGAAALDERRLGVEQSNSSVVLGERLILKLYRRLEPGLNPDLEVSAFLADVGFADTPALAGYLTYEPEHGQSAAAAMLQAVVSSSGDAWASMLEALVDSPESGIEMAARIGDLTARLHAALASRPEDPDFPSGIATPEQTARWRAGAEQQLAQALTAVSGPAHERFVSLAPIITARFADTFGASAGEASVSRIHGEYHLGQLLRTTDGGFTVIDFEGEPARPLAERRAPGSPLRDVAGMLRSLDYAARSAETGAHAPGFEAEAWLARAREALLAAYGGIGSHEGRLLAAFELEKACYEVRYEANNRPAWLWLPLAAVERLAAAG
ncbi:hypothetical protein BH20CHL8_BH20CHL8_00770 [soil metagenome]